MTRIMARLLSEMRFCGNPQGFPCRRNQRPGLVAAFGGFIGRVRIGNDASARLHMHGAILEHGGAQDDAAVDRAIRREIADPARVRPAGFRLQLGNDLASPDLGGAGNRARREAREQRIQRIPARRQLPASGRSSARSMSAS